MSNNEQDYGAWRTEQHRRAQAHAFTWAENATAEYGQAIRHESQARARHGHDHAWQRDRAAEERRLADFHGVRTTEALRLAEMWSRVARALADGELPPPVTGNWISADRLAQWDDDDSQRPRPHLDLTADQRAAVADVVDRKRADSGGVGS